MAKKNLFELLHDVVELVDTDVVALEQQLAENNETLDVHYFTWLEQLKHTYLEDRTLNLIAEFKDLLYDYGVPTETIVNLLKNHNMYDMMCSDGKCFFEEEYTYTLFEDDPIEQLDTMINNLKKGTE